MAMIKEQSEQFKQRVYDPYAEAWSIMKSLRDSNLTEDDWYDYDEKCKEFLKNHLTEIGESIYRVLLDCGSEVARIVEGK